MRPPSNVKSMALGHFLLELSQLTQKFGFHIEGPVEYDGWSEDPYVVGNGVRLALIYDETRQEYDAV